MNITKKEFVARIHEDLATDTLKQAAAVLNVVEDIITDALENADSIVLPGIGKFDAKVKHARVARNPKTGALIDVPPKVVVTFKTAKSLKDALNGK